MIRKHAVAAIGVVALSATLICSPKAEQSSTIPARPQVIETISEQQPILDGKFVAVTYADRYLDTSGQTTSSTTRQGFLPAYSSGSVQTTQVLIQTISGSLAEVPVPADRLDQSLKSMENSANVVRILRIGSQPVVKAFRFALDGNQYDTPWNVADQQALAKAKTSNPFQDLDRGRWSAGAIYLLVAKDIVHGVGNGRFAPQSPVTRAEFLTMLAGTARAAGFEMTRTESVPKDTPSWATSYTSSVKAFVDSVQPGSFDLILGSKNQLAPNKAITRAEAAQIMSFFCKGQSDRAWSFRDWNGGADRARVNRLVQLGGISGTGNGKFSPNDTLTREQMASMSARLLYIN